MNVWKTVAMVGAVSALVAPAANATYDRMLPATTTYGKVVKASTVAKTVTHHRTAKTGKTSGKGTTGKGSTNKGGGGKGGTGPIIIVAPTTPVTPMTTPAGMNGDYDCLISSGTNCTNEQLCDIWAVNCDLVVAIAPAVEITPAANPAPAADPAPSQTAAVSSASSMSTDSSANGNSAEFAVLSNDEDC